MSFVFGRPGTWRGRRAVRFTSLGACHARDGGKVAPSSRSFPPTAVRQAPALRARSHRSRKFRV